jgi:hypothetical protein
MPETVGSRSRLAAYSGSGSGSASYSARWSREWSAGTCTTIGGPMTAGRRSLVALVAAAAMLVPAAAAPAAGSRIVLVTQNVRVTLGPVHARHDVRQAARGADVLALQEMNRRRVTRYLPASWHAWQARGPAGETAVAWRPAGSD